jgi:hypothetical protein
VADRVEADDGRPVALVAERERHAADGDDAPWCRRADRGAARLGPRGRVRGGPDDRCLGLHGDVDITFDFTETR